MENTESLEQVAELVPEAWKNWVLLGIVLLPYVTRAAYSVMRGGGIVGISKAIFLGTNTPLSPLPPPKDRI